MLLTSSCKFTLLVRGNQVHNGSFSLYEIGQSGPGGFIYIDQGRWDTDPEIWSGADKDILTQSRRNA